MNQVSVVVDFPSTCPTKETVYISYNVYGLNFITAFDWKKKWSCIFIWDKERGAHLNVGKSLFFYLNGELEGHRGIIGTLTMMLRNHSGSCSWWGYGEGVYRCERIICMDWVAAGSAPLVEEGKQQRRAGKTWKQTFSFLAKGNVINGKRPPKQAVFQA